MKLLILTPLVLFLAFLVYDFLTSKPSPHRGPESVTGDIRRSMDIALGLDPKRHRDFFDWESRRIQGFHPNPWSWEVGGDIQLKSGHRLMWSDEHEAPGFHATSFDGVTKETTKMLLQVDSDVAWSFLIEYARGMTEEEHTVMAANIALSLAGRRVR